MPRQAREISARRDRKVRPARRHDDILPPPSAQRRRRHPDGSRRAQRDGLQESDLRAELDSRRPRLRGGLYKERPHRQALHLRRARQARAAAFERRGRHSGNHPQPRRTRARDRRGLDSDRRRLPCGPGLRLPRQHQRRAGAVGLRLARLRDNGRAQRGARHSDYGQPRRVSAFA